MSSLKMVKFRFFDDDAQRLWLNSKPTLKMFLNKQEKEKEEKEPALYLFHVESYRRNKNENANHQLQFSYLNEENLYIYVSNPYLNNVRNGKVDGCAIETRKRELSRWGWVVSKN